MTPAEIEARIDAAAKWLRPGAPDCSRPACARAWFSAVSWFEHAPNAHEPRRAYQRAAALLDVIEGAR